MGYVIVEFPERREVLIGGRSEGYNRWQDGEYRTFFVGDGQQTFRLGGPPDFEPDFNKVEVLADSSIINPQRIVFTKKASP